MAVSYETVMKNKTLEEFVPEKKKEAKKEVPTE